MPELIVNPRANAAPGAVYRLHLTTAAQWAEAMTHTMEWLRNHGR